jgi:hypothetical protein
MKWLAHCVVLSVSTPTDKSYSNKLYARTILPDNLSMDLEGYLLGCSIPTARRYTSRNDRAT